MKKKLALMLSCMVLCALVLVGCGGGNNGYVGTKWELTHAESHGLTMDASMVQSILGEMSMEFVSDSKVEIKMNQLSQESEYTLSGDKILVEESNQTLEFNVTKTDDEGAATELSVDSNGSTLYFEKK